jgi:hypothetical protein
MTLPYERTNAVISTEKFLLDLINAKKTPRVPSHIREQARSLLRHYPSKSDLYLTANGWQDKTVQFVTECPFANPDEKFW